MSEVDLLWVLSKVYDDFQRLTSFDRVCCPRAMLACHARHRSTLCGVQGLRRHATPDVFLLFVLSKGDDCMPRPTLSDYVYTPRAKMECHARHRSFLCVV